MIAWAFANAEILSPALFAALGSAAEGFLDEFTEEELDNMEWAFSRVADQSNLVKALRRRRKQTGGGSSGTALSLSSAAASQLSSTGRIIVAGGGIGGPAVALLPLDLPQFPLHRRTLPSGNVAPS